MGDGVALVATHEFEVPAEAAWLDPQVVVVPDGALPPGLAGHGEVVVVRPDRYVAAVTTDLAATGAELGLIAG